jgi:hypothetical protein
MRVSMPSSSLPYILDMFVCIRRGAPRIQNFLCIGALTFGRVLKTTVHNRAQKLRLEHEVLEVGSVDTYVVSPVI